MTRKQILIVEDETSIREMYEFKLKNSGYNVLTAKNGVEGLEVAESNSPNLILVDIKMPIMSGDEMLEKLRATEWGASMRVIVLTNINKSEAPSVLRFLNVDRYIIKAHTTPSEVVKIAEEVLSK